MTKDETLKMLLVHFELWNHGDSIFYGEFDYQINAIKEALAQPEQEPDWKGLVLSHNEDCESRCDMDRCGYKPYYEYNGRRCPDCPIHEKIWVEYTPPQRTWVGLTEAQCGVLWKTNMTPFEYYQAIEAKLKEKNT